MHGYISIGSNIDKDIHIPASIQALETHFGELLLSSIYESEPVGFSGELFHNLIVRFESDLDVKTVAKKPRPANWNTASYRPSMHVSRIT